MIKINNKFVKRISLELEVEHPSMTKAELEAFRKTLRKKFKTKIKHFEAEYDNSLYRGGIELKGEVLPLKEWKHVIDFLVENGFGYSVKCGLHIHVDCSFITTLDQLKTIVYNIKLLQQKKDRILMNHITPFHNIIPTAVLDKLLEAETIEEFVKIYLSNLRGYKMKNLGNELSKKDMEHYYWIDLLPLLRKLLKDQKLKNRRYLNVGSIEIRGTMFDWGYDDIDYTPLSYEKFIHALLSLIWIARFLFLKREF